MSAQGCLERVLQVDTRHLPLARPFLANKAGSIRPAKRDYKIPDAGCI